MIGWINKKRNQKGFTLIELIVVIAILGIIAAIAIPRFDGVRDKATIGAAKADARTILSAVGMHYAEKESYPASGSGLDALSDYLEADSFDGVVLFTDAVGNFKYTLKGQSITTVNGKIPD